MAKERKVQGGNRPRKHGARSMLCHGHWGAFSLSHGNPWSSTSTPRGNSVESHSLSFTCPACKSTHLPAAHRHPAGGALSPPLGRRLCVRLRTPPPAPWHVCGPLNLTAHFTAESVGVRCGFQSFPALHIIQCVTNPSQRQMPPPPLSPSPPLQAASNEVPLPTRGIQ